MVKRVVFRIVKIALLLLVILTVATFILSSLYTQRQAASQMAIPVYKPYIGERADIQLDVTGTGSVSPRETTDIIIDWSGKVQEVNFENGDLIEQGDIIARVVNETISSEIESATNTLRQQEINLARQIENLTQTVDATDSGRIKMLKAAQGDDLNVIGTAYGQICYISPDGKFTMTFTHTYGSDILKDSLLQVRDSDGLFLKAVVTDVVDKRLTIDILDDYMLEQDEYVQVYRYGDENGDPIGDGHATIKNAIAVRGQGKAAQVLIEENDIVAKGQTLFVLDSKDAELSYESQTISVSDAQRRISDLRKDIGKNDIPAPVSGVISALNLKQNTNAQSGSLVATIQSVDLLETVVNIDELDIAMIRVGQQAKITLDALEGRVFTGVVTKIAVIGENVNGFATYPVTVAIDAPGEIKIGMSCEVKIIVDEAFQALTIPVELLSQDAEGYYVTKLVQYQPNIAKPEESGFDAFLASLFGGNGMPAGTPQGMASPEGSDAEQPPAEVEIIMLDKVSAYDLEMEIVRVTVGIVNENYVEILSGLTANDIVLQPIASISPYEQMMMMMGGGGMYSTESSTTVVQTGR